MTCRQILSPLNSSPRVSVVHTANQTPCRPAQPTMQPNPLTCTYAHLRSRGPSPGKNFHTETAISRVDRLGQESPLAGAVWMEGKWTTITTRYTNRDHNGTVTQAVLVKQDADTVWPALLSDAMPRYTCMCVCLCETRARARVCMWCVCACLRGSVTHAPTQEWPPLVRTQ